MRRVFSLAAALTLTLSLAACTALGGVTGFDATLYVRGMLDEMYHADYDPAFLKLVDSTEAEAEEVYRESMAVAYEYFCARFEMDDAQLSAATRGLLQDLLGQVYKAARYEVHAAVALEGGEYAVRVTAYPVTVLAEIAADDYPAAVESFNKLYADMTEERLAALTPAAQKTFWQAYEEAWAAQVATLLQARIGTVTRGEAEVMLMRVFPAADGNYRISDRELALLDELLISY